jgi:hypothetical protein
LTTCLLNDEDGHASKYDINNDDNIFQEPVKGFRIENLVVVDVTNGFLDLLAFTIDNLVHFVVVDSSSELLVAKALLNTKRRGFTSSFRLSVVFLDLVISMGVLDLVCI